MLESIEAGWPAITASRASDLRRSLRLVAGWGGVLTLILTWVCLAFIDLPLAAWLHATGIDQLRWTYKLLNLPIWITPLATLYMLWFILAGRPLRTQANNWFVVSCTLMVAGQVKNMLKIAFGRTWPRDISPADIDLVLGGALSRGFVNDGLHVFRPFSGLKAYTAFPSGTTVSLMAVAIPLCYLYPKWRLWVVLLTGLTYLTLVQTNTHFLGDVVAGLYVGAVVGLASLPYVRRP